MTALKLFTLFLIACLAGCESMSVSECKVADWSRTGFADGANGTAESRLADYTEDCGKAGIQPDARAYRKGWDAGIQRYCTPFNGWREGTQGNSGKSQVCQGQAGYDSFAHYLEAGLQVHRTQEKMRRNNQETDRLQKQLESATKDDDKKRLRNELRDIDHSQRRLREVLAQQQLFAP
jgi:hypothetical protein